MQLRNSHGGYGGKTLAEKMRDKTDQLYAEWMKDDLSELDASVRQGRIEGACEMMAILTSTNPDLQWDSTEARYDDKQRQNSKSRKSNG